MKFVAVLFLMVALDTTVLCEVVRPPREIVSMCGSICSCEAQKDQHFVVEYLVICNGNKTQNIILSSSVYINETKPDWTRKVHVRISNYTGARITEGFLARWSAYTSCSLEIWNCGTVVFPRETPLMAETKAITFKFAVIGVIQSSIDKFSNNLFKNKETIKIKLSFSEIGSLNLLDLAQNKLNYLDIENSIIKIIEGNPAISPKFGISLTSRKLNFKIQNSKIGYVGSNALIFDYDYEVKIEGDISIQNTTFGILEPSAINLGDEIKFTLEKSTLSYASSSALTFGSKRNIFTSVTDNIFGIEDEILNNVKCNTVIDIKDNILYVFNSHMNKSFMDDSCKYNSIVGPQSLSQSSISTSTVFSTTTSDSSSSLTSTVSSKVYETPTSSLSTTLNPTFTSNSSMKLTNNDESHASLKENGSNTIYFKEPAEKLSGSSVIPIGLFYLVVGLCLVLMTVVLVLTTFVVWNKIQMKNNQEDKVMSSTIYEEPNSYFAPNPPKPLKIDSDFRFENRSEDNRYHVELAPINKRKENLVFEEESTYLNMMREE